MSRRLLACLAVLALSAASLSASGWLYLYVGPLDTGYDTAVAGRFVGYYGVPEPGVLLYNSSTGAWVKVFVRHPPIRGAPARLYTCALERGVWSPGWKVSALDADDRPGTDVLLYEPVNGSAWIVYDDRGINADTCPPGR